MFAIGDRIRVQDVPDTEDIALVTEEPELDIVRDYTFEELILTRESFPEALGPFATLSTEELRKELQEYHSFLVEVNEGDYSLVIGFSASKPEPRDAPTILYAPPRGFAASVPTWAI
jgi:hypothetical protein